jgi:hypothetical protein
MAKKKAGGDSELNLDSLMDAVTNVVGVLMIVFIVMALQTSRVVQKILSDLPPVTEEQHQEIKKQVDALPPPPATPEEVDKKTEQLQQSVKKATEELSTIDTTNTLQSLADIPDMEKQLAERRKERDLAKVDVDKLFQEIRDLKARLDSTPIPKPAAAREIRLPDPRPVPENPRRIHVFITKEGVYTVDPTGITESITNGLDSLGAKIHFTGRTPLDFKPLLEKIVTDKARIGECWTTILQLGKKYQIAELAQVWNQLSQTGIKITAAHVENVMALSASLRGSTPMKTAEAVLKSVKGDHDAWIALDPNPAAKTITVTKRDGKLEMAALSTKEEIKADPGAVFGYFMDLGEKRQKAIEAARTAKIAPIPEPPKDRLDKARKILTQLKTPVTPRMVEAIAQLAYPSFIPTEKFPEGAEREVVMAQIVLDATKGNFEPWKKIDPTAVPGDASIAPTFVVEQQDNRWSLQSWGEKEFVPNKPEEIIAYFVRLSEHRQAVRMRPRRATEAPELCEADLLIEAVTRLLETWKTRVPLDFKVNASKTGTTISYSMTLRPTTGESAAAIQTETSLFQRYMRYAVGVEGGMAKMYVSPDAVETYLEARRIADDLNVPVSWDYDTTNALTERIPGYAMHQRDLPAATRPGAAAAAKGTPYGITKPKEQID